MLSGLSFYKLNGRLLSKQSLQLKAFLLAAVIVEQGVDLQKKKSLSHLVTETGASWSIYQLSF